MGVYKSLVDGAKWTGGAAKFLPEGGAHGQCYATDICWTYSAHGGIHLNQIIWQFFKHWLIDNQIFIFHPKISGKKTFSYIHTTYRLKFEFFLQLFFDLKSKFTYLK